MIAKDQEARESLQHQRLNVAMEEMMLVSEEPLRRNFPDKEQLRYTWQNFSGTQRSVDGALKTTELEVLVDSGEVTKFSMTDSSRAALPTVVSRDTALSTALAFMEKALPLGDTEMLLRTTSPLAVPDWVDPAYHDLHDMLTSGEADFTFFPVEQDIPVMQATYFVRVSLATNEVIHYERFGDVDTADLPDPAQVISMVTATENFLNNMPLRLVYYWPEWIVQMGPAPLLVYTLAYGHDHESSVDAISGQILTRDPWGE
jgi:hypothetical protein